MDKLRNDIKNKSLSSLYLFTGEEQYLIKMYEKAILNAYLPSYTDMNLTVFDGKQAKPEKIIDAAETLPFLSEKRIVIVRDSGFFAIGRKDDSDVIADYIADYVNDTAILIFIEHNVDKRSRVFKSMKKSGSIVTFDPLTENKLIIWHSEIMKKNGLYLSTKDSLYLFRICSGDMDAIIKETEKLCAYKKEGKIDKVDIEAICSKTNEAKIFDLIDAIGVRNCSLALRIYNELISLKETPVGILAMISRQIRLMLKCGLLKQKGRGESEISKILSERPFSVKIALAQSRNFTFEILEKAALDLVSCDTRIKSGLAEGRLSVETLIIKYTNSFD